VFQIFHLFGAAAVLFMFAAGFTGLFGPNLRKIIKGPAVTKAHRIFGVCALLSAILHGLIYILYLM